MTLIAGIDGGGTKCQVVILDHTARWAALGRGGPCNSNFSPASVIQASFVDALTAAREDAGGSFRHLETVVVSTPTAPDLYRDAVERILAPRQLLAAGEGEAALAAGSREPFGVGLIAGTGSLAFGRSPEGRTVGCGAWGALIGDEGSAYDIAIRGIAAAARAYDGRGSPTVLVEMVEEHLRLSSNFWDIVPFVYGRSTGRREIAAVAPVVTQAARLGDRVARSIVRRAAREHALLASTTASKLGMSAIAFDVSGAGGLYRGAGDLFAPLAARYLRASCPLARVSAARYDPAVGCALIALRRGGATLDDEFYNRLDRALALAADRQAGQPSLPAPD